MDQGESIAGRRDLLRRILNSAQLAHAESLRRILQFLCDRSQDENEVPLKEHAIAVHAMGRPVSFDPKTDPVVRVSVASIRERLRAYFENEGRNEPLHLLIPKGQYHVCFVKPGWQETAAEESTGPVVACRRFWGPYLSSNVPNILVYRELLFFRDNRGNYIRNIYVNDLATAAAEMRDRLPEVPVASMEPSFHFVAAGEARSLLAIQGTFHEMGAPLEVRSSRFLSWSDLQRSNLILLGGSRTNPFLNSLQGNEAFVITAECIRNVAPQPGEEPTYRGQPFLDGKLERLVEYAVVTRRPALVGNNSITLIAANHARAIEGAGLFLSCEDKVGSLLEAMGQNPHSAIPPHFQILLRIDMIDFDEEVVNVEYLTHRVA